MTWVLHALFISHDCADRLGLSVSELSYVLIVSTLAETSQNLSLLFELLFPN